MKLLSTSLFVIILFSSYNASYCQTEKGNIFLGGESSLDFKSSSHIWNDNNTEHDLDFFISPRAGIFILDDLAAGLSLPIGMNSYINKNDEYKAISRFYLLALLLGNTLDPMK